MKKCPKCKAEIQEEARFCLYCMTSFEEKQTIETPKENNKRWLYILAAVLVLVLVVLGIVLLTRTDGPNHKEDDTSVNAAVSNDLDASDDRTTSGEQQKSESHGGKTSTTSSYQTQASSKNEGITTNKPSDNTTANGSASSTSTHPATTSGSTQNSTVSNNTTNSTSHSVSTNSTSSSHKTETDNSHTDALTTTTTTTATSAQTATVTYVYRDAKYGDDFSVSANLENAVVITGVKTSAADGTYIIPETLGGKRVVAIMALAFCDDSISSTVKTVVVPSSVKTIWNKAFANCYNLTDIYFKGNSIYTESNAFPNISKRNGTLTIHCSANCSNRNYSYYKNSASSYGAVYEEWNG